MTVTFPVSNRGPFETDAPRRRRSARCARRRCSTSRSLEDPQFVYYLTLRGGRAHGPRRRSARSSRRPEQRDWHSSRNWSRADERPGLQLWRWKPTWMRSCSSSPSTAASCRPAADPGVFWLTMRAGGAQRSRFVARIAWSSHPDQAPSVKFADQVEGRLDLTSAWPVVAPATDRRHSTSASRSQQRRSSCTRVGDRPGRMDRRGATRSRGSPSACCTTCATATKAAQHERRPRHQSGDRHPDLPHRRLGARHVETGGFLLADAERPEQAADVVALAASAGIVRRRLLFGVSGAAIGQLFDWAADGGLRICAQIHSCTRGCLPPRTDIEHGTAVGKASSPPSCRSSATPSPDPRRWGWWSYRDGSWQPYPPPTLRAGRARIVQFRREGRPCCLSDSARCGSPPAQATRPKPACASPPLSTSSSTLSARGEADIATAELLLANLAWLPIALSVAPAGADPATRRRLTFAARVGRVSRPAPCLQHSSVTLRIHIGEGGEADLSAGAEHHGGYVARHPLARRAPASGPGRRGVCGAGQR